MPIIYEDGNYLTEKGRALIAKLMASKSEIEFTRAAVGSGTIPEGLAPKDMTDLAKWEAPGLISDISTPVPGEAQTVFQVFSRDVETGFLASEGAIWAKDPDEGEILYTYIVIANSPEWIRAANDPVQKFAEFTCINIVGGCQGEPDGDQPRGHRHDGDDEKPLRFLRGAVRGRYPGSRHAGAYESLGARRGLVRGSEGGNGGN